jgi:4-phospho-D-threonate 3-dehydrogenase / 4-phospho-D-erythronate 3-dehydrogenase
MKIIGISVGDPAGIGTEILVKSFRTIGKIHSAVPLVIGDIPIIEKNLGFTAEPFKVNVVKTFRDFEKERLNIYSPDIIRNKNFPKGKDSKLTGNASFLYVTEAIKLWKQGFIDALVTLPISKKAWNLAGHNYSGHTELLAKELGVKKYAMIMMAGKLKVLLVTTHIPLKEVAKTLTVSLVVDKVCTGYESLVRMGIKNPVVGIAALNPHAGEGGIMGIEENNVIGPAMKIIRGKGIRCIGPFPSDTIFKRASDGEMDMVAAMYHDQGMIPLKTFYFSKLVNYTAGLGMVRTSPGHGTGFDIAYKGKADPSAFIESYKVAVRLLKSSLVPLFQRGKE